MEPYVGEIRCFAFGQIPQGWVPCDGRTLPIMNNQALYALIGVQFGGDAKTNFAVPDLRGRVPFCFNPSSGADPTRIAGVVGTKVGTETVTLNTGQLPAHTHEVNVSDVAPDKVALSGSFLAQAPSPHELYAQPGSLVAMAADSVTAAGADASHNNMQPFAVVNFCIATTGLWPPRP